MVHITARSPPSTVNKQNEVAKPRAPTPKAALEAMVSARSAIIELEKIELVKKTE
jgi:hypothetical protein